MGLKNHRFFFKIVLQNIIQKEIVSNVAIKENNFIDFMSFILKKNIYIVYTKPTYIYIQSSNRISMMIFSL